MKPHTPPHARLRARTPGWNSALLTVLVTLLALSPARAASAKDWAPGKYMNQALVRIMASVRKVTEKTKYGLDDASSCFIGAYILEGAKVTTRIPLEGGKEYAFLGGGDDDVTDLDLYLVDEAGDIVAKDEAKDSNPVLVFTPKSDGKYKLVMKLVSTNDKGSFCCYSTLREGGFDVPVANLAAASGKLLGLCERINEKLGWAAFQDGDGEICLIGSIMTEGQTLTQGGITLEDRPYAFIATADAQAEDIDLKVANSDGEIVAQDEETDPTPVVLYSKGGTVSLKLVDAKSKSASLCMAAIVKLKAK